ncbi:MAG TPA: extracellular solute-binding protein [Bacteroidetes bacterium]|nr:extracellular solute-binding protein [Bacteroidota bacterium]
MKKIYYADNISTAHQELIDRFNEEHAGKIEVVPVNLPFSKFSTNERKELLTRAFRSKTNRIDVFAVDLIWVPRFAKWSEPLDNYFSPEEESQLLKYAINSCYFQGRLVAHPFFIDIGLMYYRKDILRKLPDYPALKKTLKRSITWEDFIRLGRRLKPLNHPFYVFQADNYEGLICSFYETLLGQGRPLFRNGELQLQTPEARRGLQLLTDLVNRYQLAPRVVTQFKENPSFHYALAKDAIFVRGWPGAFINNTFPDSEAKKIPDMEMAAVPHFKGQKPVAVYGGWDLMISKESTQKKEAAQFLKFVVRKDMQELLYEKGGYIPINRAVYQDSGFLKKHPQLIYLRHLLDMGVYRPSLVEYTRISDIISYYTHLAIQGELPVSEALRRAAEAIHSKRVLVH